MPRFHCHFEHPSRDIVHETGNVTQFWSILVLLFGVTRTTVHLTHRYMQKIGAFQVSDKFRRFALRTPVGEPHFPSLSGKMPSLGSAHETEKIVR